MTCDEPLCWTCCFMLCTLSVQSILALHFIASQCMVYGVMLPLDSRDRTGTASFIGHNDAASYFVEYEGRRHGICIAFAFRVLSVFYGIYLAVVVRSEFSPRFGDELVLYMYEGVGVIIIIYYSLRRYTC